MRDEDFDLIKLTETWAARITLCGNAETLGIGNDTSFGLTEAEATSAVLNAGQEVVTDWSPCCEAADVSRFFPNWNGGKFANASYRSYGVAAELYHRDPEANPLSEEDADLVYGEWEWASPKETPRVLADGMEALVERVGAAMDAAKDAMEANAVEEEESAYVTPTPQALVTARRVARAAIAKAEGTKGENWPAVPAPDDEEENAEANPPDYCTKCGKHSVWDKHCYWCGKDN